MFMRHLLALVATLLLAVPAHAAAVRDPASPTILLTGANRGVGLALAKEYASQGWNVIATCRNPRDAAELQALAKSNPKVIVERLDVASSKQLADLAKRYRGVPIDVLFNNAALLGDRNDKGNKRQRFGSLDEELFAEVMRVNVLAPLKISEAFVDNVAASQQKKIIGMTSGLGSLTLMGRMSNFYFYQMSKAALNMGFRAMRNDLGKRGIIVAMLAPGMVETDMLAESGFTGKALTPAESAGGLYKLVAGLTLEDKGLPVNVDGKVIPW
ncbi:MAG: SDR family oxidoreductase [Chromatiales bacterium]|jgi:NAD(P)-dependent dehydrogenase (short-subunit alcohol dehydrogenase family)|nr:SDR family oxidoreductase [Chromatiales bacterium]